MNRGPDGCTRTASVASAVVASLWHTPCRAPQEDDSRSYRCGSPRKRSSRARPNVDGRRKRQIRNRANIKRRTGEKGARLRG
eukprot:scaffold9972_cov118-Isochrysis_galbana.AAC.16